MITFGVLTGSLAFNQKNELTHASRDGARYGATLSLTQLFDAGCNPTNDGTTGVPSGSCWAQNIAKNTRDNASGNLGPSVPGNRVCVAVVQGANAVYSDTNGTYWYDSNGGAPTPCFDDGGADLSVRVQVVSWRSTSINAVLFHIPITLESDATAQVETQPPPPSGP